jgi:hypothetical protein
VKRVRESKSQRVRESGDSVTLTNEVSDDSMNRISEVSDDSLTLNQDKYDG